MSSRTCKPSVDLWFGLLVGCLAVLWSGIGLAQPVFTQPERPGDVSRQMAAAKARFFGLMEARETQPTLSQDAYDVS